MHLRRSILAVAAAISVALMSTGAVFASDQSVDVTQTVTVESYTTLTVDPQSIDFGTTLGNTDVFGDSNLDITWASNNADGIVVSLAATDFVSGSNVIAKANETVTTNSWATSGPADGYSLASTSGPTSGSATLGTQLHVPFDAVSGDYTSTLTVSATEN